MTEYVILVNENDEDIGQMEKIEAHNKGLLHRAFSLFIVNAKGQMLIHQRAMCKYHSPSLWTNACCSHPRKNESIKDAVIRRTKEELNISINPQPLFQFTYKSKMANGMVEHEYDHVYVAEYNESFEPNPLEVMDYTYVGIDELLEDVKQNPAKYTTWFAIALPKFAQKWTSKV